MADGYKRGVTFHFFSLQFSFGAKSDVLLLLLSASCSYGVESWGPLSFVTGSRFVEA